MAGQSITRTAASTPGGNSKESAIMFVSPVEERADLPPQSF
jgi:hypothetical protein